MLSDPFRLPAQNVVTPSAPVESRTAGVPNEKVTEPPSEKLPVQDPERRRFDPEELLRTWQFYSVEKADLNDTWKFSKGAAPEDAELICTGTPFGYLRSKEVFEDYELGFEWKYPADPNGNSGVLVHTVEDDKIWPKSIQVQLHAPTAGSIFPSGGATAENRGDAKNLSRPVNEWNTCVVTSQAGRISAVVNGSKVGEVTGCVPSSGQIALQSEGSLIHFRRIWIRNLKPDATADVSLKDK